MANPFWAYWYFHIPNYLLAALVYTLLGRFVLGLFVPQDWSNYIWRFFRRLTDPVLAVVRVITPRLVHDMFLPLVAVFWILVLRVLYWMLLYQWNLTPSITVSAAGGT